MMRFWNGIIRKQILPFTRNITQIKFPPLPESVKNASILKFIKNPGEYCEAFEDIIEAECDKGSIQIKADKAGKIMKYNVKLQDEVDVSIALGELDENAPKQTASSPSKAEVKSEPPKKQDDDKKIETKIVESKHVKDQPKHEEEKKGATKTPESPPSIPQTYPQATDKNKDFSGGRTTTVKQMTRLRKVLSEKLKNAQNITAMLTTFNEVDMSELTKMRKKFLEEFNKAFGIKLGFMSAFVKEATLSLQKFPIVNAKLEGNNIMFHNFIDIAVAVGAPQGLITPVLRNCEILNFANIEKSLAKLAQDARDGKLALEDMIGGTFTITNGGVYGSMMSTPIINYPQSAILGMHSVSNRPVCVGEKIEARPVMYIALSYDHRIIDGREAVLFLKNVKDLVEDPRRIILEL